jgi:hypothetical protein
MRDEVRLRRDENRKMIYGKNFMRNGIRLLGDKKNLIHVFFKKSYENMKKYGRMG